MQPSGEPCNYAAGFPGSNWQNPGIPLLRKGAQSRRNSTKAAHASSFASSSSTQTVGFSNPGNVCPRYIQRHSNIRELGFFAVVSSKPARAAKVQNAATNSAVGKRLGDREDKPVCGSSHWTTFDQAWATEDSGSWDTGEWRWWKGGRAGAARGCADPLWMLGAASEGVRGGQAVGEWGEAAVSQPGARLNDASGSWNRAIFGDRLLRVTRWAKRIRRSQSVGAPEEGAPALDFFERRCHRKILC
jgi:hypothetical protein